MFNITDMVLKASNSWFLDNDTTPSCVPLTDNADAAVSTKKDMLYFDHLVSLRANVRSATTAAGKHVPQQKYQEEHDEVLYGESFLRHLLNDITNSNSGSHRHSGCKACCHIVTGGCSSNDNGSSSPRESAGVAMTTSHPRASGGDPVISEQYDPGHNNMRGNLGTVDTPLQHTKSVLHGMENGSKGANSVNTLLPRIVNSIYPAACKKSTPAAVSHACVSSVWPTSHTLMCEGVNTSLPEQQAEQPMEQRYSSQRRGKNRRASRYKRAHTRRVALGHVGNVDSPSLCVDAADDGVIPSSQMCMIPSFGAHAQHRHETFVEDTSLLSSATAEAHNTGSCSVFALGPCDNGVCHPCRLAEPCLVENTAAIRSIPHRFDACSRTTERVTSRITEAHAHERPRVALCQEDYIPYDYEEEINRVNDLHSHRGHDMAPSLNGAMGYVSSHEPFSHAWLNEQKYMYDVHCATRRELWVKKLADATSMDSYLPFKMKTLLATAYQRDLAQLSALPPSAFDDRWCEDSAMRFSAMSWSLMLHMRRCTAEERKQLFIDAARAQWRTLRQEMNRELYAEKNQINPSLYDAVSTSAGNMAQRMKHLTLFNTNPFHVIREFRSNVVDEMRAQRQSRAETLLRSLHEQGRLFRLPRLYAEEVVPCVPVGPSKPDPHHSPMTAENKLPGNVDDPAFDTLSSTPSLTPILTHNDVTLRLSGACGGTESLEWTLRCEGSEPNENDNSASFVDLDSLMLSASSTMSHDSDDSYSTPTLSFNPVRLASPSRSEVQYIAIADGNGDAEMTFL